MFREAISEYERVLSLDPGFVLSYFNLGEVYRALGDRTRAVECYKKFVASGKGGEKYRIEAYNVIKELTGTQ
jgi:tetratricopeptide (TPR) repeat protein